MIGGTFDTGSGTPEVGPWAASPGPSLRKGKICKFQYELKIGPNMQKNVTITIFDISAAFFSFQESYEHLKIFDSEKLKKKFRFHEKLKFLFSRFRYFEN